MLALAAEDLAELAREVQSATRSGAGGAGPQAAVSAALALLSKRETLAAAATAMNSEAEGRTARLFNGRLIGALSALAGATGTLAETREGQADVLLMAATLIGLALLARSGRLDLLGFTPDEMLSRLPQLAARR